MAVEAPERNGVGREIDAFTHHTMSCIEPKVRQTLTPEQLSAIEVAVSTSRARTARPLNIRGTIPLFFKRFYIVFVFGRDRRESTREVEFERRRKANFLTTLLFLAYVSVPVLIVVLVSLYFMKTALGIDLFAGHIWDYLPF